MVFFLIYSEGFSQNLVPNGDFSDSTCVTSCAPPNQFCLADWYNPTDATPDYFGECWDNFLANLCGSHSSFFPVPQAGIIVYNKFGTYREYISVKLSDSLEVNQKYHVEFYVKICKSSIHAIDKIGIYIGDSIQQSNSLELPFIPQIENPNLSYLKDSLIWYKIAGNYTSFGGEQFITIGNFRSNALTNIDSINTGNDYNSYYLIDNVSITKAVDTTVNDIGFYPNPNNGNFALNYNLGESSKGKFKVYNSIGQLVYQSKLIQNNGSQNFNLNLASGVYVWSVETGNAVLRKDKFVVVK